MVFGIYNFLYMQSAYHNWCCEFESWSGQGPRCTTLCDKVCQWLATGHRQWFSPDKWTNKLNTNYYVRKYFEMPVDMITIFFSICFRWESNIISRTSSSGCSLSHTIWSCRTFSTTYSRWSTTKDCLLEFSGKWRGYKVFEKD